MAAEWLLQRRQRLKTSPRWSVRLEYASAAIGWPNHPSFRLVANCFPLLVANHLLTTAYNIRTNQQSAAQHRCVPLLEGILWNLIWNNVLPCRFIHGHLTHSIQESTLKLGRLHSDHTSSSNDSKPVCLWSNHCLCLNQSTNQQFHKRFGRGCKALRRSWFLYKSGHSEENRREKKKLQ